MRSLPRYSYIQTMDEFGRGQIEVRLGKLGQIFIVQDVEKVVEPKLNLNLLEI